MVEYWFVMYVLERKEVYFIEGRRDCTYSGMGLVWVVFVESLVN